MTETTMIKTFARQLLCDFYSRMGLYIQDHDEARIERIAHYLELDKEILSVMGQIMEEIANIERAYDVNIEQAVKTRASVYSAICNRYFSYRFARLWTFKPADGENAFFLIPGWFCNIIRGLNWSLSSLVMKIQQEAVKTFIWDADEVELQIVDQQVLFRIFVFAYEHGEIVGFC